MRYFVQKNLCTHTISVKIVFHYHPYVKGTQNWENIGICIASILYIGESLTGCATRKYWAWTHFFNIVESQIIAEIKIYILLHIIVNHRSLLYSKANHISKGFKMADEKTRSMPISYSCDVQKPYESFEILFRLQTVFFTPEVKIISCKSLNQLKKRFGRVRIWNSKFINFG